MIDVATLKNLRLMLDSCDTAFKLRAQNAKWDDLRVENPEPIYDELPDELRSSIDSILRTFAPSATERGGRGGATFRNP